MKTRNFLLGLMALIASGTSVMANDPSPVNLLPDGTTVVIEGTRKTVQRKNVTVAGSAAKGYKAFFTATNSTHGEELWITDGTPQGTKMVKDINPGDPGSDVAYIVRFNDKVVFSANDGQHGAELWISDGTEEGTYMIKDIHDTGSAEPKAFCQLNETQFVFGAVDFDSETFGDTKQWWLWISDGTEAGTRLLSESKVLYPGQNSDAVDDHIMRVGRKVFFKGDNIDGTTGESLYVTDGTEAGTFMVKDINTETIATGTATAAIESMTNFYNEKLFFKAFSIESNNEPWASDGTPEGTYQIYDSNPTFEDSGFPRGGGASQPGIYNGKVYFRGFSLEYGTELAMTNLERDNFNIIDIFTQTPSYDNNSFPDPGVAFDGVYIFCAATGFDSANPEHKGGELRYTDGNTVSLQYDLAPGNMSTWAKEQIVCGGSMYFVNVAGDVPERKEKILRINSKDDIPVVVTNLNPDGDFPYALRNLNGTLIFAAGATNSLYSYAYRKSGYDPTIDPDVMEIEFRTREEIASSVNSPKVNSQMLEIYPNPAKGFFSVNLTDNVEAISIVDIAGKIVYQSNNLSNNQVNIENVASGFYTVRVVTSKGNHIGRLVVNQ